MLSNFLSMNSSDRNMDALNRRIEGLKGIEIGGGFKVDGVSIHLDLLQRSLDDLKFSFDYRNQRILHFTNLDAALSIIGSRCMNASSVFSFRDKHELTWALEGGGMAEEDLAEMRKYTFVASFTQKTNEDVCCNYHQHWKEFGNNGLGVAFEFEILSPHSCYSVRAKYIDKCEEIDNLSGIEDESVVVIKALSMILGSLKKKSAYSWENEVRLLFPSTKEYCVNDPLRDFGFRVLVDNEIDYFYKLPFSWDSAADAISAPLRLHAIHVPRSAEVNDGQYLLNKILIPWCDQRQIKRYWK